VITAMDMIGAKWWWRVEVWKKMIGDDGLAVETGCGK